MGQRSTSAATTSTPTTSRSSRRRPSPTSTTRRRSTSLRTRTSTSRRLAPALPGAPHCSASSSTGRYRGIRSTPGSPAASTLMPGAWSSGRRFRDTLRNAEKKHKVELHWQLDEIPPECGTSKDARLFVSGVILGLAQGRPKLGDKPKPGFVWIAAQALAKLPGLPITQIGRPAVLEGRLCRTKYLVGEEYPEFVGDAGAVGQKQAKTSESTSRVRRCALSSTRSALHRRHDPRIPRAVRRGSPWQCQAAAP